MRRRDHAALDRLAFLHAQPGEDVLDPLAGEDPHQVVFQREVEAAAAGIALPAAAAAKLEVDAAGLVPLGAEDVQAAHLGHVAALGLHLLALLDLVDQGVPFLRRHVEPRGILLLKLGPGHRLGIAAEDDVGAAAGHVRGDGHGALAAGLGDDLGLALVMLGVEHLVLHAPLVEHVEISSLRSIETVPTRIGRPRRWISSILLAAIVSRSLLSRVLELDRVVGLAG